MGRVLDLKNNSNVIDEPVIGRVRSSKQSVTPQPIEQKTNTQSTQIPTPIPPQKTSFLSNLKSKLIDSPTIKNIGEVFLRTNPLTSTVANLYEFNKVSSKATQPLIDKTLNTESGKNIITTTEKATRGSSILLATPKAFYEASKDIITGEGKGKDIVDYYDEAVKEWEQGGKDPTMSWTEKVSRGVLDSGVQSAVGVLLNLIPVIGRASSATYFSTLSAAEQVNERGEVNSLGNITIDVAGDMILGNMIEGIFKKPAKDLIKSGFLDTTKKTLGTGLKGFVVEGVTEPTQTLLKYANDYRVSKSPEERNKIIEETKDYVKNGGMLLEFLVGGISGAGISTIASIASQSDIDPNIPKPKLGISEDEDKKFNAEQNKIREAFREDIKQDLTDTAMNKPYVARQLSKETGLDNSITTLLVDEVAESIKTEPTKIDLESISKQALNEAGTTIEETKPEETIVEQPKTKMTQEQSLIEEARKFKTPEEFVSSKTKRYGGEIDAVYEANRIQHTKEAVPLDLPPNKMVTIYRADTRDFLPGDYATMDKSVVQDYVESGRKINEKIVQAKDLLQMKNGDVFYAPNGIKSLTEIWNKAHEGEVKMKISDEADKFGLTPSMKDNIVKIIDDYELKGGKDLELQQDASKIAEELDLKMPKAYGKLVDNLRDILEKSDQYYKGLDTLKTKDDNKEYESKQNTTNTREVKEGIQPDRGGIYKGDGKADTYKVERESRENRVRSDTGRNDRDYDKNANRSIPKGSDIRTARKLVSEFLPEVEPKTIDKIVSYYSRLNKEGFRLDINRQTTNDYEASMQSYTGNLYVLSISNIGIEKLSPETIDHEIGTHSYYPLLLNSGRESLFNSIKEQYKLNPEKFSGFTDYHQKSYWKQLKGSLEFHIRNTNPGMNIDESNDILRQADIIDENNEVIFPEDIMEATFNFKPISDRLNKVLEENGYRTTDKTNEYNNLMAEEIVAFVAENSESFKDSTVPVLNKYANDIVNDTLEFKKQQVSIKPKTEPIEPPKLKIKSKLEELKENLANTQKALDKAVANPEVYGQNSIVNLNQKVADLRRAIMEEKYPKVDTGDKITDAKTILEDIEKKLGVSSVVNSLKEKQSLIELSKEVIDQSPMKEFEPYVADAGAYKGTLPEVTGKTKEELKKNPDFKGVKNEKTFQFAQKGDSIAQEITSEYGMDMDSNEVRAEFEDYQTKKANLKEEEKKAKQEAMKFGQTDTFQILGKDKSLIGEIAETRGMPLPLKEIMDQVREEKKARREEVLNHPARPLMKYVDKKTNKLPEVGSNTAFGKSSDQILKDLGFDDVKQANRDIQDYITKRDEFVNPISRLRMQERAAKFLRDKAKIMEEVERKVRAEARDRKSKIEAIRDFFYMTDSEVKEVIGDVDYRLVSDKQFEEILKNLEEKSIEIAERQVAVAEVEWTIAQKELHRVENLMELMGYPKNLSELTIEQLNNLNDTLSKFQHGDVFLGVREMETLMKNAKLNVQTQREILQEVIGKRTNVPIEEINKITATQFDKFRSAVSLARQNPFYEIMVNDAYALKVEAAIRYQEIENKTNELVKKARESRRRTLIQRLIPTDDMVIAYLEEGDLDTKQKIAKDMSKDELELAHYIQDKYIEMRDYLMSLDQLERYRKDYVTHRPRGFFEAWLRDGATKSPKQFIVQFAKAFKETVFDVHKVDSAAFNITSEKGKEILPLEKFFKYSMRRSGQLIPTRNIAKAFLGYVNTFEVKRGLDKYVPRMEAVARALTPQETTEGGLIKDTTLENFVAQWINTQKGRPLALKFINPGDTLDTLLRAGVAFTRTLDLALRIPAQVMSLVGEESATWINIGNKRYLLGQYRAKTSQGKKIAKKYEGLVGKTFWDKMRDDSKTFESKLGETMFAFYGIAAKKANVHHLLGSLTKQEFESGEISTERLGEIKQEMTKWRADDVLSSVMGKTSIGGVFRQHKSWAIPILTQTLSNLQDIKNMVASGEFKTAAKSKQFGELFRATMLTLILTLTLLKWYRDLKDKKDRNLIEELAYRAINDSLSFISALNPKTLFVTPRLLSWITDLSNSISTLIGALVTGEKTAEGKTPGLAQLKKSFTPKLFSEMLKDTEQDKVMASISRTTSTAQKQVEGIKKEIVEPAQLAWEKVKELGVGTEEADAVVNELSDDEYEAYKLVKKADTDYWVEVAKKVTPTVQEAYKVGFGTEEADALIEDLSDDEYAMYKKVKQALYGKEDEMGKDEWDEQTFKEHIVNMAKGWATDPVTAFDNLIHGDWKILGVRNGQIIVNRMPKSASTEIREKAMKNNEKWKLDHTVPLKGGGTNRSSNLSLIPTEEWEENTPVELYLIEQLKDGKIDGDKLREYIIRYKVGVGRNVDKKIIKEYNKKYDGKPITFQEIKNEIDGR